MIRHISKHLRDQNSFALVVELLIVVMGVFLGLQTQEWAQQREDRRRAEIYRGRLAADFTIIDKNLRACLSVYKKSVEAVKEISRAAAGDAGADSPRTRDPKALENALVRMTAGFIPAGRSATFIEMLSTGDLSILRDATLRDALVVYDETAQVNREIWRSLRDESIAYRRPLYDNLKIDVDLDRADISSIRAYDLEAMARDPAFQAMLNVLAGNKGNNYELCKIQLNRADKVQTLLAQEP